MRRLDPWDIESGTGFTTGKSFPGHLPVGNLFVIPRDHRRFAEDLELELWVNDGLRQRSKASEMIWDVDEILARTWERKDVTWDPPTSSPATASRSASTASACSRIRSGREPDGASSRARMSVFASQSSRSRTATTTAATPPSAPVRAPRCKREIVSRFAKRRGRGPAGAAASSKRAPPARGSVPRASMSHPSRRARAPARSARDRRKGRSARAPAR